MKIIIPYNLGGFLMDGSERAIERYDLLKCDVIKFVGVLHGTEWEEFEYLSEIALRNEDEESTTKPYRYIVICRRSGSRIIILSHTKDIVEHLLEKKFSKIFVPKLKPVSIAVDGLVKSLTKNPTKYSLSFVHARVPAFGTSLRSVSYYGDDIAEASLFRENIHFMNFFTCGLRPTIGKSEIVRIGSDGSLSFYASTDKFKEIENIFRFLRKEGYLSTDVLEVDKSLSNDMDDNK